MQSRAIRKLIIALACTGACSATQADVVIVVAANNPVGNMSKDQIAQIFTGKAVIFPDGRKAVPIEQGPNSPTRNEFHAKVTGKDAAQLKAYWSKVIFSGAGQPPKEVSGADEMRKAVSSDASAIGYLEKSQIDSSLKVILTP